MADFAHVLRRAEGRLRAPEPQRSRILLEIAQDLEDAYRGHLARGCSDQEARRRAEAVFAASDGALEELGSVHRPALQRLLDRFSGGEGHALERGILSALALLAVAVGMYGLITARLTQPVSPFAWPLLVLLLVATWACGWMAIRLYMRVDQPPLSSALLPLLGLGGLSLTLGLLALLLEIWQLAGSIESGGASGVAAAAPFLRRAAGLLTLALTQALAILFAWFHLRRRALEIERVRLAVARVTFPTNHGGEG